MKINLHIALSAAISPLVALSLVSCHGEKNELAHHHHHEEEASEPHIAGEIVLDEHQAEHLGVKVSEVKPGAFYEVLPVEGKVVAASSATATVAARSGGIVRLNPAVREGSLVRNGQAIASVSARGMAGDGSQQASTAVAAAKRELDRLRPLHADGIVSTRDFNAAQKAYDEAVAAANATRVAVNTTAVAPISGTIIQILANEGQYVNSGDPICLIANNDKLSLLAYVPEKYRSQLGAISGASFKTTYSDKTYTVADLGGKLMPGAATAAVVSGYIPVYFSLSNAGNELTNGALCEVYLQTSQREGVLSLPRTALSEQQGEFFVYVQIDSQCYEKRRVQIGDRNASSVEITKGLHQGEKVVTEGTTFLRLAETSGVKAEGHSHNH